MASTLSKETDGVLALPATQNIETCVEFARRLAAELKPGAVLVVDAGAFHAGDVTFVQTLVAARKSAELMDARVEITHAPPALAALLKRCGLDDETRASLLSGI